MSASPSYPGVERRIWRRAAVGLVFAVVTTVVAVFGPAPSVTVAAEVARVRTERVALSHRPASAGAAATAEVRRALEDRDRRSTRRGAEGFDTLAVTTDQVPDGPVLARSLVDGRWSPWFEVPFTSGESPDLGTEGVDARGAHHSEPVWLGDADGYEIDAPAQVASLDVHLIGQRPTGKRLALATPTAAAATAPTLLSRSAWGARPPKTTPTSTTDLKLAIVHHSVTPNGYAASEVPAMLRSIQAYHQDVRGWNDIAYSYAVDRFGRAWTLRGATADRVVVGGHSQGFNTGTLGVMVLGDYTTVRPTSAAVESVARVIAWFFAHHEVVPSSTVPFTSAGSTRYAAGVTTTMPRVVGHRDTQTTSCPGAQLYRLLPTIRARVNALVPAYQPALGPTALKLDVNADHLTDALEYQAGATADAQWRASALRAPTRTSTSVSGTYRPAVGDFDGNGYPDVLWHGSGSAPDSFWWYGGSGAAHAAVAVSGSYRPVVGDFDGNGIDDIFWYGTGLAADSAWYFEGFRAYSKRPMDQDLISGVPLVGDYDGDGRDDIFWYAPGDASDSLWRSTGRSFEKRSRTVSGLYDPAVLDANGDGRSDIAWVRPGSSTSSRWDFAADLTHTARVLTTPVVAGRPNVGDYDGDGRDDLFLYGPGDAGDAFWYSSATGVTVRTVTVRSTSSAVATGPMDLGIGANTDDVLLLSRSGDTWWRTSPTRTHSSVVVG